VGIKLDSFSSDWHGKVEPSFGAQDPLKAIHQFEASIGINGIGIPS
jgi:hypothetical protein